MNDLIIPKPFIRSTKSKSNLKHNDAINTKCIMETVARSIPIGPGCVFNTLAAAFGVSPLLEARFDTEARPIQVVEPDRTLG